MNPYLLEFILAVLGGFVAALGLMAAQPEASTKAVLVVGGLAACTALVQSLRALKQQPPGAPPSVPPAVLGLLLALAIALPLAACQTAPRDSAAPPSCMQAATMRQVADCAALAYEPVQMQAVSYTTLPFCTGPVLPTCADARTVVRIAEANGAAAALLRALDAAAKSTPAAPASGAAGTYAAAAQALEGLRLALLTIPTAEMPR